MRAAEILSSGLSYVQDLILFVLSLKRRCIDEAGYILRGCQRWQIHTLPVLKNPYKVIYKNLLLKSSSGSRHSFFLPNHRYLFFEIIEYR